MEANVATARAQLAALHRDEQTPNRRAYQAIANTFVFDELHGLDRCLSTEIRHGIFSNWMRSHVEEQHLLTRHNSNGVYESNRHWRENYHLLRDAVWADIDQRLREFSRSFNAVVEKAEGWMRCAISPAEGAGMFKFEESDTHLGSISAFADTAEDAASFGDFIVSVLWAQTEEILQRVEQRLDSEFRTEMNELFGTLTRGLADAKSSAALKDLMSAVMTAQNGIKSDITTAAGWFRRVKSAAIAPQSLDRAIEIAFRAGGHNNGQVPMFDSDTLPVLRTTLLPGQQSKCFTLAIVNLIDNCFKHSGLGQATSVQFAAVREDNNKIRLVVSNNVDEAVLPSVQLGIELARNRLSQSQSSVHMRTERGTGLVKVLTLLREVTLDTSIDVAIDTTNVSVTMVGRYENLGC